MPLPETNLALIARLKRPVDERAWQEFVSAYEPFLLNLMRRRGFSDADSRDIVQQVFLSVCRSLEQWNPDGEQGSFRRWLTGVTRNTLLKFLRYERRHPRGQGGSEILSMFAELPSTEPDGPDVSLLYDREVFLFAAESVRREFRERSWMAFWKTAVEGRPADEVARELHVERGSVYMSRSRIMARIRSKLEQLGEDR